MDNQKCKQIPAAGAKLANKIQGDGKWYFLNPWVCKSWGIWGRGKYMEIKREECDRQCRNGGNEAQKENLGGH